MPLLIQPRSMTFADLKPARSDKQIAKSTKASRARLRVLTICVSGYGTKANN
jgi:hypothetical protein